MSRADEKLNPKNLNPKNDEDLEMLFSAAGGEVDTTPPEGLLERLLNDIPQDVSFELISADDTESPEIGPAMAPELPANDNRPRYWLWSVAAGLVLAVGLGSILVRNTDSMQPSLQLESEGALRTVSPPAPAAVGEAAEVALKKEAMKQDALVGGRKLSGDLTADADDSASAVGGTAVGDSPVGGNLPTSLEGALQGQATAGQSTARQAPSSRRESRSRQEGNAVPEAKKQSVAREQSVPRPSAPAPRPTAPPAEAETVRGEGDVSRPEPEAPSPVGEVMDELVVTAEAPLVDVQHVQSSTVPSREEHLRALGYVGHAPSSAQDRAFEDNFFDSVDTNPFIDTEDDRLSTFGLDVDTGSYGLVREYLSRDALPPRGAVRVEEMVNYFDYGDAPPQYGEGDFAFNIEGAPSISREGGRYYTLRIGLKGREVDPADRKPALLTFVIDVSGSMEREDRLGLVKKSLSLLIDQLKPRDRMALVVYGTRGRVLLEPTSNRERIRRAINALHPEGSTNAGEGLQLAYEMAAESKRRGEINRIILCSDGVANVGKTSADDILEMVRDHAQQGVELTTVGFGMGNYNDILMEQLADRGNGRYAYVDSVREARRIFVEDLTGTLQTIAAEARAQVEMNPEIVSRYRLLGYENRDIADERFRDDTVDAGEIGAGHTVTVLYELKTTRPLRKRDPVATVHLRYASMAEKEMVEQKVEVRGRDFAPAWNQASSEFRLAASVAELAEVLRQSYWARDTDPRDLFVRLQKVAAELPGDTKIAELATLAGKVADLEELRREKREGTRGADRD